MAAMPIHSMFTQSLMNAMSVAFGDNLRTPSERSQMTNVAMSRAKEPVGGLLRPDFLDRGLDDEQLVLGDRVGGEHPHYDGVDGPGTQAGLHVEEERQEDLGGRAHDHGDRYAHQEYLGPAPHHARRAHVSSQEYHEGDKDLN